MSKAKTKTRKKRSKPTDAASVALMKKVGRCINLVEAISRFTLDYEIDDDGHVFKFGGNDDEHDKLVSVVQQARAITGFKRESV